MKLILVSAAALTLVGGTAVSAQQVAPDHRGQQQSDHRGQQQSDQRVTPGWEAPHHWARGQTLPDHYRTSDNYVDYRSNHLRRPHAGRRWVKVDNDNFAEVSLTTGIIYQIIAHH
jgi:Ni/Co efflux regulator RcnB